MNTNPRTTRRLAGAGAALILIAAATAAGSSELRIKWKAGADAPGGRAVATLPLPSGVSVGAPSPTFGPNPVAAERSDAARAAGLDRWFTVPVHGDVAATRRLWQRDPRVEVVEDVVPWTPLQAPSDPLYPQQWEHDNTGANPVAPPGTPDADLDSPEAWALATGAGVRVTNFETVAWYHEDLVDRIWQNLGEDVSGNGTVLEWDPVAGRYVFDPADLNAQDDDGNGFVDDLVGWNFWWGTGLPDDGPVAHGTGTAGFLVADHDNGAGVAGMCPDCVLIAVRGRDLEGLTYAIDYGAQIISLSLTSLTSQAWADFVAYAESVGVLIVAAGGNSGTEEASGLCIDGVLCVSGTNHRDRIVTLQNTGGWWGAAYGKALDLGAPAIFQTYLRADGGYGTGGSGTSNATPLVAGIAALVREVAPSLSVAELRSILESTVDPFDAADRFAGNGRANAHAAVQAGLFAESVGSHPVANIDAPATMVDLNGYLRVMGTLDTPHWSAGSVRIGVGLNPSSWLVDASFAGPQPATELASLDVTGMPAGTEYAIEIEVVDSFGQVARDRVHPVRQETDLFEPIPWPLAAHSVTSLVLGDLTGDGASEVVTFSDAGWNAISGAGAALAGWPAYDPDYIGDAALVALDDAPGLEVVVNRRGATNGIYALRADGTPPAGWPVLLPDAVAWSPVAGDVDGDGAPEIIVLSGVATANQLNVLRRDGTAAPGWPQTLGSIPVRSPVVADLDGDGDLEIAGRTYASTYAYHGDGQSVAGFPVSGPTAARPLAADLDADGRDELLVFRPGDTVVLTGEGQVYPGWPRPIVATGGQWVADFDGDEALEILLREPAGALWLLEADGSTRAGWPVVPSAGSAVHGVADVDGDGAYEVIYVDPVHGDAVGALDAVGGSPPGWPFPVPGTPIGCAAGSMDHEGRFELLAQCFVVEGDTLLHRYPLPVPWGGDGWWREGRDASNGRRAKAVEGPTASDALPGAVLALAPPRPNPATSHSVLRWQLPRPSPASLRIYDVTGRRVRDLRDGFFEAGPQTTIWDLRAEDGRPVAPSVYFVRLATPSRAHVQRLVVRP